MSTVQHFRTRYQPVSKRHPRPDLNATVPEGEFLLRGDLRHDDGRQDLRARSLTRALQGANLTCTSGRSFCHSFAVSILAQNSTDLKVLLIYRKIIIPTYEPNLLNTSSNKSDYLV